MWSGWPRRAGREPRHCLKCGQGLGRSPPCPQGKFLLCPITGPWGSWGTELQPLSPRHRGTQDLQQVEVKRKNNNKYIKGVESLQQCHSLVSLVLLMLEQNFPISHPKPPSPGSPALHKLSQPLWKPAAIPAQPLCCRAQPWDQLLCLSCAQSPSLLSQSNAGNRAQLCFAKARWQWWHWGDSQWGQEGHQHPPLPPLPNLCHPPEDSTQLPAPTCVALTQIPSCCLTAEPGNPSLQLQNQEHRCL